MTPQSEFAAQSWRAVRGALRIAALGIAIASQACAPARAPEHGGVLEIAAHAEANGAVPRVRLEMRKGTLRLRPGVAGAPFLVAGTVRATDDSLLPHVTTGRRGVAIVQDFEPEENAPSIMWDLALGSAPMHLDLHVRGSENQDVDLGGRSLASARVFNDGGHLRLAWSAPAVNPVDKIELWSIGYLEVSGLGRSRAKRVEVRSLAGLAEINVGRVEAPLMLDAENAAGSLVIAVPRDAGVVATVAATAIKADGFTQTAPGVYSAEPSAPVLVTIAARVKTGSLELVRR